MVDVDSVFDSTLQHYKSWSGKQKHKAVLDLHTSGSQHCRAILEAARAETERFTAGTIIGSIFCTDFKVIGHAGGLDSTEHQLQHD